jgi:hypothetical protein
MSNRRGLSAIRNKCVWGDVSLNRSGPALHARTGREELPRDDRADTHGLVDPGKLRAARRHSRLVPAMTGIALAAPHWKDDGLPRNANRYAHRRQSPCNRTSSAVFETTS